LSSSPIPATLPPLKTREKAWHARRDLNPRPLDSKSTALSTELRAHQIECDYYSRFVKKMRDVITDKIDFEETLSENICEGYECLNN
jgi:hypothetical protein